MKAFLTTLVLVSVIWNSYGQTGRIEGESWSNYVERTAIESDHLEPVDSYFDYFKYEIDYKNKIRSFLLDTLNKRPLARLLVLPSFTSEYVINLENIEGTYVVTKVSVDRSIWYAENPDDIKIIISERSISKTLADKIDNLFETALDQTKYKNNGMMGTDGTTYYFTSIGNSGRRTATKWSPRKGTKINQLIGITEALTLRNLNEDQLIDEIDKLMGRF
ncbi:hypothetical protein [Reichenbachiella ulvae]|uniref:DUF4136 domain-containing protein n=1 Tax=Reichenbachiella ulvae TaxID=2980104 RepID=A0ABT3CSF8_9BACT|nr:hypothetical protein [Reichenbachiella ulvae]MCV9386188.1 hypothetical protein [Reichenbachiella ulvae]